MIWTLLGFSRPWAFSVYPFRSTPKKFLYPCVFYVYIDTTYWLFVTTYSEYLASVKLSFCCDSPLCYVIVEFNSIWNCDEAHLRLLEPLCERSRTLHALCTRAEWCAWKGTLPLSRHPCCVFLWLIVTRTLAARQCHLCLRASVRRLTDSQVFPVPGVFMWGVP
jgi:hypothetical protein